MDENERTGWISYLPASRDSHWERGLPGSVINSAPIQKKKGRGGSVMIFFVIFCARIDRKNLGKYTSKCLRSSFSDFSKEITEMVHT